MPEVFSGMECQSVKSEKGDGSGDGKVGLATGITISSILVFTQFLQCPVILVTTCVALELFTRNNAMAITRCLKK